MHLGLSRTFGFLTAAFALALTACSNSGGGSSPAQSTSAAPAGTHQYVQNTGKSLVRAPQSASAAPANTTATGQHYVQNTGKSLAARATNVNTTTGKTTLVLPRIPSLWGVKTKVNSHPAN